MLTLIHGCGSPPSSVEEISSQIKSVTYLGESPSRTVQIEFDAFRGSDTFYFFVASEEMFEVLEKLKMYFVDNQTRVEFVLNAVLQDQYGNSLEETIMTVPFSMAEIEKVNFDNPDFLSFQLLNLAEQVNYSHPIGRDLVRIYCVDQDHRRFARRFCSLEP